MDSITQYIQSIDQAGDPELAGILVSVLIPAFCSNLKNNVRVLHKIQEPTYTGNTGPWLADNQSRDLNLKGELNIVGVQGDLLL